MASTVLRSYLRCSVLGGLRTKLCTHLQASCNSVKDDRAKEEKTGNRRTAVGCQYAQRSVCLPINNPRSYSDHSEHDRQEQPLSEGAW